MSNLKELKSRIKSVNDTKKITNAMYLISSTKMNRAKREFDNCKPYFDLLKNEIANVFSSDETISSDYFYEKDDDNERPGTYGYFIITSDKGLCGSYNVNVLKKAMPFLKEHDDNKIYCIGEFGRNYLLSRGIVAEDDFRYLSVAPNMRRAREIAERFLDEFLEKKITKLFVIYTNFENGILGGEPDIIELLPFKREHFDIKEKRAKDELKFMPDATTVLENIVDSYLVGYIYSILTSSFCSEQAARMNAMNNANDNAKEILTGLQGEYNKVRQEQITREIIEISSGAKAKKKKELERKGE